MKKSLILLGVLFLVMGLNGKDIRYLTISGEADERLNIEFEIIYQATTNYYDPSTLLEGKYIGKNSKDLCTRDSSTWNGGPSRSKLRKWDKYEVSDSKFTVKLPIDYPIVDKCAYEFVSVLISVNRKETNYKKGYSRDKQYSRFTLLSNNSRATHRQFTSYGGSSKKMKGYDSTSQKYYFLGNSLEFDCITEPKNRYSKENNGFYCYPIDLEWGNGVDEIKDMNVTVNINIDESKEKFMKFEPKKLIPKKSFLEKLFN